MPATNVLDNVVVLDAQGGEVSFRDLATETQFSKILFFPGDPNGVVSAPLGSVCLSPIGTWRNTDGALAWINFGAGVPTGSDTTFRVAFTFLSGTVVLQPLVAGDLVHNPTIVIETPFDDPAATVTLGTNLAPGILIDGTQDDPQSIGRYPGASKDRLALGAEDLELVVTPGASTQGAGYVLFTFSPI